MRKLSLSAVLLVAVLSSTLGPAAGSAQGACISIGAAEVDFGRTVLNNTAIAPHAVSTVKNECGEKIEFSKSAFGGSEQLGTHKNECSGKALPANASCLLQFKFKPKKVGNDSDTVQLWYFTTLKLKEEEYAFKVTGRGVNQARFNQVGALNAAGALVIKTSPGVVFTCSTSSSGEIWNGSEEEAEAAAGELSNFTWGGCETNLPGCTVNAAYSQSLPWGLQSHEALETAEFHLLDLEGISVLFELGSGCVIYGLPTTVPMVGSATGAFENSTSCLEFSEAPGLTVNGLIPATLSGELCVTEPEGLELE